MEDVVPPGRKSRGRMSDLFVGVGELVRTQDPPFQVRDLRKFYVVTTIDPARVQPFLPAGLKVAPSNTGIMSINVIGDGSWGPHTSALHGVAVAGRDSPDGMEAVYYLGGYADCGSRELWDHYYLHSIREGSGSVSFEGGKVHGDSARPDGSGRLSMTAIALDPALAPVPQKVVQDSSYHYLGDAPDGTARIFSMYAYAKTVIPLRVEKIEMSPDLPAALLALAPVGIQWGVLIENMNVLLGAPRAVGKLGHSLHADHLKGGLLSIIDRHARPAVLVDAANRLRFVNRRAERDHGDWLKKGMTFNPGRVEYRTGLAEALMAVRGGGCVSTPVVIRPPNGSDPIVVHFLAANPGLGVADGVVLVFSDLADLGGGGDPVPLLRLLGLTPAEARLAAALGAGRPTRDAAEGLGIAEATARTTLKTIYQKLGIGRQSELARIVARLELA